MGRSSTEIELVALEAIQKAIETGHIDISKEQSESVAESLYILLNQYEEENNKLRLRVQRLEQELAQLRLTTKLNSDSMLL